VALPPLLAAIFSVADVLVPQAQAAVVDDYQRVPQTGMHKRGTVFLPNNASKRVRHLSGRWHLAVLRQPVEGWEGMRVPEAADKMAA
jgi:hypothetical protein